MNRPPNFDRLARCYRALEFLAFGRDLERARFCLLPALAECRSLLVLGEGDGRCLARLVRLAPRARIDCVDLSPAMLARAARRLAAAAPRAQVSFIAADAFSLALAPGRYDAVVTLFFLDCFSTARVRELVARIQPSLVRPARWLFADFVLPAGGWRRARARLWLAGLYTFFRWQTGLPTRELPESERVLAEAGWQAGPAREFQHGLIRTRLLQLPE